MKANYLSLGFKILGALILLVSLILNGFGIWNVHMQEVVICVIALQTLVLPIDISKIREAKNGK